MSRLIKGVVLPIYAKVEMIHKECRTVDICRACEEVSGHGSIDGATRCNGLWRVLPFNETSRALLLTKDVFILGEKVRFIGENPFLNASGEGETKRTKLIVTGLPFSYSNEMVARNLTIAGYNLSGNVLRWMKERDRDGNLTDWRNGRRYVFAELPETTVDSKIQMGSFTAYVYYREMVKETKERRCYRCLELGHIASECKNEEVCHVCRKPGHRKGSPECLGPAARVRDVNDTPTGEGGSDEVGEGAKAPSGDRAIPSVPQRDTSAAPGGDPSAVPEGNSSAEPESDLSAKPVGASSAKPESDSSAALTGNTSTAHTGDTSAALTGDTSAALECNVSAPPVNVTFATPCTVASAIPSDDVSAAQSGNRYVAHISGSSMVLEGATIPSDSSGRVVFNSSLECSDQEREARKAELKAALQEKIRLLREMEGNSSDRTIFGDVIQWDESDQEKAEASGYTVQSESQKADEACADLPPGETVVIKGRKKLFPVFQSVKRTIIQAVSPEGKSESEPSAKKTGGRKKDRDASENK